MKKSLKLIIILIFIAGCAQEVKPGPEVQKIILSDGQSTSEQQTNFDCSTKFLQSQLCLSWEWENKPQGQAKGAFTFKVFRPNKLDGTPVVTDLATLPKVVLWMPAMGHGSAPTVIEQIDVGTYRCKDVYFVMPGQWELRFQQIQDGVKTDEAVVAVTI